MEAVMLANIEVFGLLISKGCDVRAEDKVIYQRRNLLV